jgi:GcrA cell cycle regulator
VTRPPEWSEERIARVRLLWDEKVSTRLIALDLGVTKNAIIGVARRRGFTPRPSPIHRVGERPARPPLLREGNVPAEPRAPRAPKPPQPTRPLAIAFAPGQRSCQWPTGDERPFVWCDAPRIPGGPYCSEHDALAHVPTRGAARA